MQLIELSRHISARPDCVFALLVDTPNWPRWSIFTNVRLERKGILDRLGVGAIRVMKTNFSSVREQIIDAEPGIRFSYRLLSGLPLKDYRSDVDLASSGDGTDVRWRSTFETVYYGTGWFWRIVLRKVIARTLSDLAREAERGERHQMLSDRHMRSDPGSGGRSWPPT
jgi:hypothetical protein